MLLAAISNDAIVTILGIAAGIALGVLGIYQRMGDYRFSLLSERIAHNEKELMEAYDLIKKYTIKYGKLE